MDEIQRFIDQLGYIINKASRKWIEQDSKGALTVGYLKELWMLMVFIMIWWKS